VMLSDCPMTSSTVVPWRSPTSTVTGAITGGGGVDGEAVGVGDGVPVGELVVVGVGAGDGGPAQPSRATATVSAAPVPHQLRPFTRSVSQWSMLLAIICGEPLALSVPPRCG